MTDYLVMTNTFNGPRKFLIDRRKDKTRWWTRLLDLAMKFNNEKAAQTTANKLKFGSPKIVTLEEAQKCLDRDLELDGKQEYDPFDSEYLHLHEDIQP